ncbi:MAG: Holliday junction resolvase RuvX [candidate division KSB1 bacterium]|nr:Holliday junction resolvase RuvX [candidate division KSB1 bacterium]
MTQTITLPKSGRLLAIDFGERRIGIAVTDPLQITAQARETLQVRDWRETILRIKAMADELQIQGIVIGLPVSLCGDEGMMADRVREFADALQREIQLPIVLWDERLTSLQAERTLREFNLKPSEHKDKVDRLAAYFLLRNFLDSQQRGS